MNFHFWCGNLDRGLL